MKEKLFEKAKNRETIRFNSYGEFDCEDFDYLHSVLRQNNYRVNIYRFSHDQFVPEERYSPSFFDLSEARSLGEEPGVI